MPGGGQGSLRLGHGRAGITPSNRFLLTIRKGFYLSFHSFLTVAFRSNFNIYLNSFKFYVFLYTVGFTNNVVKVNSWTALIVERMNTTEQRPLL